MRCKGLHHTPKVVEANKARRKYPAIDGLSRAQICYRIRGENYNRHDVNMRNALIAALGGECAECGYNKNIRGLVVDHRHGDGHIDRKRIGGKIARYYASRLDEAREKLQVLCATCNQIKAYENREHNRSRRVKPVPALTQFLEASSPCH